MGYAAETMARSAEQFLAWDAGQSLRHEFVRGAIFAMAGAEERHVTATGNVYVALRAHLSGTPCRTFITDMKLRVEAADCYFYPDAMVTCSAADATDPLVKREPVLIDPGTRRCDLYRLGTDGLWVLHPFDPGQAVRLESVGLDLAAHALWDEVEPAPN